MPRGRLNTPEMSWSLIRSLCWLNNWSGGLRMHKALSLVLEVERAEGVGPLAVRS